MNEIGEVRKLAAIVMMDVVGYSRLVEHDVTATLAALTDQRQTLIAPTVAAHQGRLVNAPGDSTLLEFSSVTNAVRCAIAIQQGMLTRNSTIDPEQRIALRIGVNIGDVIVQRGEIFGDGVQCRGAARNAGGARRHLPVARGLRADPWRHRRRLHRRRPRSVKNIRHPIEIYSLPAHIIAALPPILALPVGRRRRWRRLAMAIGAILVVAGTIGTVTFGHRGTPEQRRQRDLTAALASVLPASTEATRAKSIASYLATPGHRAFVIAPRAHSPWWSGEWSTPAEAEDKSLERCQAALSEPCGSLAIDDDVKGTSLVCATCHVSITPARSTRFGFPAYGPQPINAAP